MGVAFCALVVGAFHALAPRAAWYMSIGWKLKDGEPSDLYIGMSRFFGSAAAVIALIVIIVRMITGISSAHQQTAWVSQFKSNLTVVNVASVTDPFGHSVTTNQERTVLSMLRNEDMYPSTVTSGGGIGELDIQLKDGQTVSIINIQPNSWYLTSNQPGVSPYSFEDANLVAWYENWSPGAQTQFGSSSPSNSTN